MTRSDKMMHIQHDLADARKDFYKSDEFGYSNGPLHQRFERLKNMANDFRQETMDLGFELPYPGKKEHI